jgi:hypothetical protein
LLFLHVHVKHLSRCNQSEPLVSSVKTTKLGTAVYVLSAFFFIVHNTTAPNIPGPTATLQAAENRTTPNTQGQLLVKVLVSNLRRTIQDIIMPGKPQARVLSGGARIGGKG